MTSGKKVSRKAPPASVEANTSVRTLILGIDRSGRIVQHDRTAPKILARDTDDLLGVHLSDITANPSDKAHRRRHQHAARRREVRARGQRGADHRARGRPERRRRGHRQADADRRERRRRLRDHADPGAVRRAVRRPRADARHPAARHGRPGRGGHPRLQRPREEDDRATGARVLHRRRGARARVAHRRERGARARHGRERAAAPPAPAPRRGQPGVELRVPGRRDPPLPGRLPLHAVPSRPASRSSSTT